MNVNMGMHRARGDASSHSHHHSHSHVSHGHSLNHSSLPSPGHSSSAAMRARAAAAAAAAPPATNTQECHICLEDLRQDLAACPCGHVFHEGCILQALEVNAQCPICRGYVVENLVVRLYFDVPEHAVTAAQGEREQAAEALRAGAIGARASDPQVAALNERVAILVDRLQWQKKQHDMLLAEMKRLRLQTEQLMVDKQTLMQRANSLDASKNELLSKVAKYQIELSRQAEAARQSAVNQSIINYLNTCDAEALEDEISNPRELVIALKKACKFRHDQYQKVVKEKTRLKSIVQSLQQQIGSPTTSTGNAMATRPHTEHERGSGAGKAKLKSPMETKRAYSSTDYSTPHPLELKKRKVTISPAGSTHAGPSTSSSSSVPLSFTPRMESSSFRSSAYTDVAVRPVNSSGMARSQASFSRSSYNPSQYGSYNLTPSSDAPVQVSDHAVCRRGYDETGKLTNYFIPKESKRNSQGSLNHGLSIPGMHHLLGLQNRGNPAAANSAASIAPATSMRPTSAERRDYALTSWLRKGP